jgi:hypothetical protein
MRSAIPSYIHDLNDNLATWYQATNDGNGWKLEKKEKPTVGDYLHSEFRKHIMGTSQEVEAKICEILKQYDAQTAVCRLDRGGATLDGWKHRTINRPVSSTLRGVPRPRLPAGT